MYAVGKQLAGNAVSYYACRETPGMYETVTYRAGQCSLTLRRNENDVAVKPRHVGPAPGQQEAPGLGMRQHVRPGGRPRAHKQLGGAANPTCGALWLRLLLRLGTPRLSVGVVARGLWLPLALLYRRLN